MLGSKWCGLVHNLLGLTGYAQLQIRTDNYLPNNCGILILLKSGDLLLADRGFTINESIALHQAKLAIPAFTKGKNKLNPKSIK